MKATALLVLVAATTSVLTAALAEATERREADRLAQGGFQTRVQDLPVTILPADGERPSPFVILLHGCDGLRPHTWARWVKPWASLLRSRGIGVAVVDSFGPRGIDQVCNSNVAAWARRRAADAVKVAVWLNGQPFVQPDHIALLGQSNGGRTVLSALESSHPGSRLFRAGVALYPGCQSNTNSTFVAPLFVLAGEADTVAPSHYCQAMRSPALKVITYPNALHSFDVDLPQRRYRGMVLGGNADATADAHRQVIAFLHAQGMGN